MHQTGGGLRQISWFCTKEVIRFVTWLSHPLVPQAVETVEKVPFQKMITEKWDRNIEKHLVLCVPHNILAIFKPNVGDFYEDFLIKGFFDSLVGQGCDTRWKCDFGE